MKYNPNPKKGDIVRARIAGKVVDVEYLRQFYYSSNMPLPKIHWVKLDHEVYFLPWGEDRFVYPIEQMENYKRKEV